MQATATPTADAVLPLPTGAAAAPASCPAVVNIIGALRDDVPKEKTNLLGLLQHFYSFSYLCSRIMFYLIEMKTIFVRPLD